MRHHRSTYPRARYIVFIITSCTVFGVLISEMSSNQSKDKKYKAFIKRQRANAADEDYLNRSARFDRFSSDNMSANATTTTNKRYKTTKSTYVYRNTAQNRPRGFDRHTSPVRNVVTLEPVSPEPGPSTGAIPKVTCTTAVARRSTRAYVWEYQANLFNTTLKLARHFVTEFCKTIGPYTWVTFSADQTFTVTELNRTGCTLKPKKPSRNCY